MTHYSQDLITLQLDPETSIRVVASQIDTNPEKDVVDFERMFQFEKLTDVISKISTSLASALEISKPNKTTIEFGIDLGLESGQLMTYIVKGTGSCTLKISLEWSKQ